MLRCACYKRRMSALACILGAFALILVLSRLKVPLTLAILAGSAVVGASMGLSASQLLGAMLAGAARPETVSLLIVTVLLLSLSHAMQEAGQMEQIVLLARAMLRRPAVAMAALPAFIGLLPMPGGALFSAPMVEAAAGEAKISGGRLSAINYWFRHIWEHWWPLYPGVILAAQLTASDFGTFMAYQLPLGIFMVAGGLVVLRNLHPDLHVAAPSPPAGTKRKLVRATSSIWVIPIVWVAVVAGLRLAGGWLGRAHAAPIIEKYLPVVTGLLFSLLWTVRMNRLSGRAVRRIFMKRDIYIMAVLVLSVMVFQQVLGCVQAAPMIADELKHLDMPVLLVIVALPFIAGMVTGLAVGFVGVSFPIVLGLIQGLPGSPEMRPYVVLAYACGHLGQMLSPLHLCHVVSNRYFGTAFGPVYKRILPAAAITAALTVGYFLALRAVMD